jgi:hypothetical protein
MVAREWTGGAGDFNPNTAGNWNPAASPGAGDDLTISRTADNIIGFDHSAVTFGTVRITGGWRGQSIGSIGAAWRFSAAAVYIEPNANMQLVNLSGALVLVNCSGTGQGALVIAGGTVTDLNASGSGVVQITSGATLTNGSFGGHIVGVFGTLGGATAPTLIEVGKDAQVISDRDIQSAVVAGRMRLQGVDARISTKLTILSGGYSTTQPSPPAPSRSCTPGKTRSSTPTAHCRASRSPPSSAGPMQRSALLLAASP